jgi:hypothetical protein
MRPLKGRKASAVYPTLIALAGLLALLACWLILLDKNATFDTKVGESQFALIQQYQEGENYLHYMDQAAEYSADEAIAGLASGGGYAAAADSDCGEVGGYTLWLSGGKECYPAQAGLLLSFEEEFNTRMNGYSHAAYLPESNITSYTLEYSADRRAFIAKPERYTDFITRIIDKDTELPPGATSEKRGDKVYVHFVELGGIIDYSELSQGMGELK